MVTKNTFLYFNSYFIYLIYNYLFKAINATFLSIFNESENASFCLHIYLKKEIYL